jgi:hypothetical protein
MTQYLLGDLKLSWNGSNPSVGGGALIPREIIINDTTLGGAVFRERFLFKSWK